MPTSQFDIFTQKAPPPRAWSEEARRFPIVFGVISTIFFHLLLWFLLPLLPMGEQVKWVPPDNSSTKGKTLDFILERLPEPEPETNRFRYVETNAAAPANEPDKTINISNRNQQSAQEEAAKEIDPDNNPTVKGREDIEPTNAVVTGQGTPEQESIPVVPQTSDQEQAQPLRAQMIPLQGIEKLTGDEPGGVGSNVSESELPTNQADRFQEGSPESKDVQGSLTPVVQGSKPQPKPRPKLKPARPNMLANHIPGTRNIGVIGIDARWNEFGEYLDEFFGIVEAQWNIILDQSTVRPSNGHVIVTFKLNSEGEIRIVKVEDFTGKYGAYAAINSIEERQPYRKWTQPMIVMMGNEQEIKISFWYQ